MDELPVLDRSDRTATSVVALVGNPNAGKTTLFNALTGLRGATANFPGTTIELRRGPLSIGDRSFLLVDLPGLYDFDSASSEEQVTRQFLQEGTQTTPPPCLVVLVLDATNLQRNLFLAGQVLELGIPTVVALNMSDLAERDEIAIDADRLQQRLGCPIVPIAARSARNLDGLRETMIAHIPADVESGGVATAERCQLGCEGCGYAERHQWAEQIGSDVVRSPSNAAGSLARSARIDRWATDPVLGLGLFAIVMLLTFLLIFWLAQFPMGWIDALFGGASELIGRWLADGDLKSLLMHGVIGGMGGMLVFLPQICILFFVLSLLEDSGYLARAALVMDRLMRRVGLPGKAFVPLLSAHACAIPAIMATRVMEDSRDRLLTILIAPLMSCSARVPVYAMVTALLFPNQPLAAACAFAGAYFLGIVVAFGMASIFRRTLLPGQSPPLILELPNYRLPSLRNAFLLTVDRAWAFVKNAGTVILLISVILWAMATYPKVTEARLSDSDQIALAQLLQHGTDSEVATWWNRAQLEYSFAGRLGHAMQPLFAPLGFDWKVTVGVVTSFAAREVIVSTLAVLYGLSEESVEDGVAALYDRLAASHHPDGSPVFSHAMCWSLLVFYVLAMQCLPTQAVTRRETGGWKWPLFQIAYMTLLAYFGGAAVYQLARWCGV